MVDFVSLSSWDMWFDWGGHKLHGILLHVCCEIRPSAPPFIRFPSLVIQNFVHRQNEEAGRVDINGRPSDAGRVLRSVWFHGNKITS